MIKTLVFLLCFFVSCFAEEKKLSPQEKKHREKIEKLQRQLEKERKKRGLKAEEGAVKSQIVVERFLDTQPRLRAAFDLYCPLGGVDKVMIHPALANQLGSWRGSGVAGFLLRRYTLVHRAKNPYINMTLNITNGGQRVVSNLCPGGSITLVDSMPPFYGDGTTAKTVRWTAEGMVEGRLAYGESSPGVLYQGYYNWEVEKKPPSWIMNLDRVDQKF